MKPQRKDYCGPYWMPKCIRKVLSLKFNASCKIHDLDYETKKYNQNQADSRFLENSLKQSKNNIFWIMCAYVYYLLIRIGGYISYGKKEN